MKKNRINTILNLENAKIFIILFILLLCAGALAIICSSTITRIIYGNCYSGIERMEVLKFIAQIIGGLAIILGLFISNWRAKSIEQNLRITEDGNITERFNQAITNLASNDLSIRLGGIYALQRIALKSDDDRSSIFEIFCSFIRQRNQNKQNQIAIIEFDTQVLLNLIFKNNQNIYEGLKADLSGIALDGANFSNAKLIFVDFSNSVLKNSNFQNANIVFTNFMNAKLSKSDFYKARFTNPLFENAILDDCIFYKSVFVNYNDPATKLTIEQFKTSKTMIDCEGIPEDILNALKNNFPDLFDFNKLTDNKNFTNTPPYIPNI